MQYSIAIRGALAAIALIATSLAHAADWKFQALEGCGGQISGTFSSGREGRVTPVDLMLSTARPDRRADSIFIAGFAVPAR